MDIQPGTLVTVEITAEPRSAGAFKTLARVCRKDPEITRRQRWQARHRPSWQIKRRGGRFWHHQMKSTPGVALTAGARYSVRASVDVIRDLASVQRWVKVTPA